jgi:anhydro-N-acetylmuramic acid kinase
MNEPVSIGLGVMSGTSLDGIDLALCVFDNNLKTNVLLFDTIGYPLELKNKLLTVHSLNALQYFQFQNEYSAFTAQCINTFLSRAEVKPEYIAVHGHTVFHQPEHSLTVQMLNGSLLSVLTGIPVVCDFRSADVAAGGQGAPLVPIGDAILFGEYEACLNLGGFANISYISDGQRIAFDIAPVNIVLNYLASTLGKEYDHNGNFAKSGKLDAALFHKLNSIKYYHQPPPKSLGREWAEKEIITLIKRSAVSSYDLLCTFTEHIAFQISQSIAHLAHGSKVLCTGGGTHNIFLVERITNHLSEKCKLVIPEKELIDAKEALIFALLGKLRLDGKVNSIRSVTGASQDTCGGAVYLPSG